MSDTCSGNLGDISVTFVLFKLTPSLYLILYVIIKLKL